MAWTVSGREGPPAPYYAGLNSFFRAPMKRIDEVREGDVAVVGVPIDSLAYGRKGGRWAPDAIRRESLYLAGYYHIVTSAMLDPSTGRLLTLPDDPRIVDVGDVYIDLGDYDQQMSYIIEAVKGISQRGAFPLILGGNHNVTFPGFEGFAAGYLERHPDAKFGYLHMDSHVDFLDEIPGLGRYNTSPRRVSENPNVLRMAWVGVNWPALLDLDQYETMKDRGFIMFSSDSIRDRGIETIMHEALEYAADGTDAVYVTIDIDIVDGAWVAATHAPSFDGISSRDFLRAMQALAEFPKMQALDVCEVIPTQDCNQFTERLAALGALTAIAPRIFDSEQLGESPMESGVFR